MIRRILAVLKARNLEFLRDRSSLGWSILMPFVLVFALGLMFSGEDPNQFTVGVLGSDADVSAAEHPFFATRFVDFVPTTDREAAIAKVGRHELDLLLETSEPARYWINPDSPTGYVVERLLLQADPRAEPQKVSGTAVRYVDWLVPGVLGMNMTFGCLFGVGYVIVRYRKNGFLKRLRATPLNAFEFITAQALSRLILTLAVIALVFAAVKLVLDIRMDGSYFALAAVATLGGAALISLALVIAARISSEELAAGLLNLLSWPMMLLSGVFFSIEGTPPWVQQVAAVLPLTQILDAARRIMIDGAGLVEVLPELGVLALMTAVFLAVGSVLFRWRFN